MAYTTKGWDYIYNVNLNKLNALIKASSDRNKLILRKNTSSDTSDITDLSIHDFTVLNDSHFPTMKGILSLTFKEIQSK